MSKNVLTLEYEYDFKLIGIVSALKHYRLCWFLNETLDCNFAKEPDLQLSNKKLNEETSFSLFKHEDELNKTEYFLISNRENGKYLLKELKQVDYLLLLHGTYSDLEIDKISEKIAAVASIQASFAIDPNSLKEKENILI